MPSNEYISMRHHNLFEIRSPIVSCTSACLLLEVAKVFAALLDAFVLRSTDLDRCCRNIVCLYFGIIKEMKRKRTLSLVMQGVVASQLAY